MLRLRSLAELLKRRRTTAAAVAVAVSAAAAVGIVAMPPTWRATAVLAVVVEQGPPMPRPEAIMGAQVDLLRSPELHRQTVAAMRPDAIPNDEATEAAAVSALAAALYVTTRGPASITVSLDGRDPGQAVASLNRLIELYLDQRRWMAEAASDGRSPAHRLEAVRQSHEQAVAQLAALRQQAGAYAFAEQRPLLLRQRAQLDLDLKGAASEAEELQGKLNTLREQLGRTPRTIPLSVETEPLRVVDEARGKLLELELREQELLGRYKEGSQLVQAVREEMGRVRTFLRDAGATVPSRQRSGANVVHQEIQKQALSAEAALSAVKRRHAALQSQIAGIDRQVADMAAREASVRDLEQGIEAMRREMDALARQAATIRAGGGDLHRHAQVKLEQAATASSTPVSPVPMRDLPLAVLAGMVAGLVAAVLADRFSKRLSTVEAVERRLGVPVLASVAFRP